MKTRILCQTQQLFMQYGIRSVSMDDIAGSLGISKKTIYQYYKDKNSLAKDFVSHVVSNSCDNAECVGSGAANAIEEVLLETDSVDELFNYMNPVVIYDLQKYFPEAYGIFANYRDEYIYNSIKSNIERGIAEGLYREDLNVEVATRFRVESFMLLFSPENYNRLNISMLEIHRELCYFFLYSLVSSKGYKLLTKYQKDRQKPTLNGKN
ncbi:MAG: TetR/AcrR family transcriptional regulator [Niabella sp.]